MKLIYIEWEDACHNSEWFSEKQAQYWHKEQGKFLIKESGWLVAEDSRAITLASRWAPENGNLGGLQRIPKTWIRKRKIIN